MKSVDDRCVMYLEMFRDEQYLQLSEGLNKESAKCVTTFCYYVAKYEGVHHLEFIKSLLSDHA